MEMWTVSTGRKRLDVIFFMLSANLYAMGKSTRNFVAVSNYEKCGKAVFWFCTAFPFAKSILRTKKEQTTFCTLTCCGKL